MSTASPREGTLRGAVGTVGAYGSAPVPKRIATSGRSIKRQTSSETRWRAKNSSERIALKRVQRRWTTSRQRVAAATVIGERRPTARSIPSLYGAVEATLAVAGEPGEGQLAWAAVKLREAAREEAGRRPRHGAVALALADALLVTAAGAEAGRSGALHKGAGLLLEPFIADDAERDFLDELNASWQRVPPLEQGPLAKLLGDA